MKIKRKNLLIIYIIAVLGYYSITGAGFSMLKYRGIDYTSPDLYRAALPMMSILALYVFFLNKNILKKLGTGEDLYRFDIFRYPVISKLSAVIILMVISVFAEALYKGVFSWNIVIFTLLAFLIGFSEEGMFRGFSISLSRKFTDSKIFWILSSTAFFALLHMVNITNGLTVADAWNQTLHSVPVGLLAGIIFAYRNTLWPLICWHFSIDYGLFMGRLGDFSSLLVFGYIIDGILLLESLLLVRDIYADLKKYIKKA